MAEPKEREMVIRSNEAAVAEAAGVNGAAYREQIVQTIDELRFKLGEQKMDRKKIRSRLKLLKMRDEVVEGKELVAIEKTLWAMAVDIEEPTLRLQRNISWVVFGYALFAFFSFITLTVTDRIMLPSFSIPYSVLLMGLVGALVSMFVKLPNLRVRQPLSFDPCVWFIIHPLVAIIMSAICFGIVQVFVPLFSLDVSDESWPYWILAWVVGLVNWIAIYEVLSKRMGAGTRTQKIVRTENVKVIQKESLSAQST